MNSMGRYSPTRDTAKITSMIRTRVARSSSSAAPFPRGSFPSIFSPGVDILVVGGNGRKPEAVGRRGIYGIESKTRIGEMARGGQEVDGRYLAFDCEGLTSLPATGGPHQSPRECSRSRLSCPIVGAGSPPLGVGAPRTPESASPRSSPFGQLDFSLSCSLILSHPRKCASGLKKT